MARCLWLVCVVFTLVNSYVYDDEEKHPTYLTAAVGDFTIMNCDLDFPQSIPIPYILNWNKDGKTVFSWHDGKLTASDPYVGRMHLLEDPHPMRFGGASINLTSVRETDSGWFECKVLFPNRTPNSRNNGTWFYLTVNGNLLAIPPINQTILENEEAHFSCVTKYQDTVVTWFKDGIPLTALSEILQRSWVSEDGSLTIRPVSMDDSGEYECEAVRSDGERQTAKANLNVQYKAKIVFAPREVHLPYGRSAMLDCHFKANPPLTNLRWEKDGFLFDPYNVQGVFYRRNGSLYFNKVDESHNGHYTCTPYNDLGTQGPSPSVHVIVQRPPVFVIAPNNMYLTKLGDTLEMPCDARDSDTDHRPFVHWYKTDKSSLPVGRYSVHDGNLTINNIQEEDRGIYRCTATNEAATISTDTEVRVEIGEPRAPYNLTAEATSTSVNLKWAAGRTRPDLEYNVWYRPVHTSEWRTLKIPGIFVVEATITNLNPGTEYEFMVLSKDDEGNGLHSKTIRVWTKGVSHAPAAGPVGMNAFANMGTPRDVQVHETSNGYLVTWDPPEHGVSELRTYVVQWFRGPDEYPEGSSETINTSYLVMNLEDGYDYHFQVSAMSYNDYPSPSDKVSIHASSNTTTLIISGVVIVLIVAALLAAAYYAKKRYWSRIEDDEEKVSK